MGARGGRLSDPDDPQQRLLTTSDAAAAAHVPEHRIWDWARRGLITPAAHNPPGHPLYPEIDVLRAEADTRRAARSRQLAAEAAATLPNAAPA